MVASLEVAHSKKTHSVEQHIRIQNYQDKKLIQVNRYRTSQSSIGYYDKGLYTSDRNLSSCLVKKNCTVGPLLVKKNHWIKKKKALTIATGYNDPQIMTMFNYSLLDCRTVIIFFTFWLKCFISKMKYNHKNLGLNLACFSQNRPKQPEIDKMD